MASSRNYQNGKIYCIRNNVDNDLYIGSSCQPLSKRMAWHRCNRNAKKKQNMRIYQKMNELEVEHFYIELIEEYPCNTVEQLRKREGELIRDLKPVLNKRIEGRTMKEYYNENKDIIIEKSKQRYNENKDAIGEYRKQYRQNNKEKIKQQDRNKYEKHIDKIRERREKYYENNKEYLLSRDKKRYENNKEEILKKQSQKNECECGGCFTNCHRAKHFRTQKHQEYIKNKNLNNNIYNDEIPQKEQENGSTSTSSHNNDELQSIYVKG